MKPSLLLVLAACDHALTDADANAIGGLVHALSPCPGLATADACPHGGTFAVTDTTIAVADCVDATGLAITTETPLAVTASSCTPVSLAAHVEGELDWDGGGTRAHCSVRLDVTTTFGTCPDGGGDGCPIAATFTGEVCDREVDVDCGFDDRRCAAF